MKRLLVIDSCIGERSPSMRGWLNASTHILPQRFDEVEFWSFECEIDEPWVKWNKIKPVTSRWAIQSIFYNRSVGKLIRSKSKEYFDNTLIQCTGSHIEKCDIRYIHFWSKSYILAAKARPHTLKQSFKERMLSAMERVREEKALLPGNTKEWWCVSRGIAEPILKDSPADTIVSYLPNSYNPQRFNSEQRDLYRKEMRSKLGFKDDDIILAFSAFGHFERKGLRQAIETINILRSKGHLVRLLVLGGSETTIRKFKKSLAKVNISTAHIQFEGLVNQMERYLSAADCFFMPSHFEAFSLAEIEAAALGLRLYLTAHPGHEMILQEHENGRLLPWDPAGMASVIEEDIISEIIAKPHSILGEALNSDQYIKALGDLYDQAIIRKWGTEVQ